ncbi:MAG TPA: hypothetical protein VEY08_16370, partial [Chloroflexia bacterium]|nr:hypothetical protein [Chloroflexia bacterium]
ASMLAHLPPVKLTSVLYDIADGRRNVSKIQPVTFEPPPGHTIKARCDLVPFLYIVHQGQHYDALHFLQWVTKLNGEQYVAQVKIQTDLAGWALDKEKRGRGKTKYRVFRWAINRHFPRGITRGQTSLVFVPMGKLEEAHRVVFWRLDTGAGLSVANLPAHEQARILLQAEGTPE